MIITKQSDNVGALASGLCLIHCLATPFIFVAQSCSASCCADAPLWWSFIDYFFIVISFFAVMDSAKKTSKNWMTYGLWTSWTLLVLFTLSERMSWFPLPKTVIYIPAMTLIVLHLWNRKYCTCKDTKCCLEEA
ncbi:MAG: MerC domain-containing protein [Saprospiraceae bacterium]|nr:MerC domain-containing protein [Saprospiraceae bacterium]